LFNNLNGDLFRQINFRVSFIKSLKIFFKPLDIRGNIILKKLINGAFWTR